MGVKEMKSKEDFETAKNGDTLCVVDFFADWCGPCKMIAPKLEAMSESEEFKDKVVFVKVNVDDLEDVAESCGISAMPTFHFYKNGQKVAEVVGASEPKIREEINKQLGQ